MKPSFLQKVTVFFLLFSQLTLQADWQWENDVAVAKLTPKGYEARFSFQNTGQHNITVSSLMFSCPCTVYHFTATTAKPGKKGTLTVVIESEKEGLWGSDLEVIVSGPSSTKPQELTIRMEKAEPAK